MRRKLPQPENVIYRAI